MKPKRAFRKPGYPVLATFKLGPNYYLKIECPSLFDWKRTPLLLSYDYHIYCRHNFNEEQGAAFYQRRSGALAVPIQKKPRRIDDGPQEF